MRDSEDMRDSADVTDAERALTASTRQEADPSAIGAALALCGAALAVIAV